MRAEAIDGLGNRCSDLAHDVVLTWERRLSRARDEIGVGSLDCILDDDSPGVPYLPNVQGQGAGVDTADPRDPVALQILVNGSESNRR